MTTRTAHCACRRLQVEADGEPLRVNVCHCTECQRRTGSPFGIGAWYLKDKVTIRGETKTFVRPIEDRTVTNHFCPECGGTGAVGSEQARRADRDCRRHVRRSRFPPPARSIFEEVKHRWLELAGEMEHLHQG